MFDLTKEEKLVLVFVTATFLIGTGVDLYRKSRTVRCGTSSADMLSRPSRNDGDIDKININTADINGLISIKGIGVKTAERIVEYRQQHGPFFYKEDIMKVKGIGMGKFEAIEGIMFIYSPEGGHRGVVGRRGKNQHLLELVLSKGSDQDVVHPVLRSDSVRKNVAGVGPTDRLLWEYGSGILQHGMRTE